MKPHAGQRKLASLIPEPPADWPVGVPFEVQVRVKMMRTHGGRMGWFGRVWAEGQPEPDVWTFLQRVEGDDPAAVGGLDPPPPTPLPQPDLPNVYEQRGFGGGTSTER